MDESKALKYEARFAYSKGILNVTPRSWHNFAWRHLRNRMMNHVSYSVGEKERILIVGVGTGGIMSYVKLGQNVQKIGIDVNEVFLSHLKKSFDTVLASASHLPLREGVIDLVFFELVLHHLKGQQILEVSLREANRVLVNGGRTFAVEPSSLNPSGFLMNLINMFHLYSRLFGGSNYEYALSPKELKTLFCDFSGVKIEALTFLHPRFPISLQRFILKYERFLMNRLAYFAWMFLITAYKQMRGSCN